MDVTTLALLGAAGGLLRGAVDFYARFTSWRVDRLTHRQSVAAGATQPTQDNRPRFLAYFDPSVDIAAALVHCLMGAGTAALLGETGQINGQYAAVVVGMSAPMLLTQLSRIQTVNEAVTGNRQPADAEAVAAEAGAASPSSALGTTPGTGEPETANTRPVTAPRSGPPPLTQPPAEPDATTAGPARPIPRHLPAPRPPATAGASAQTSEPTPAELPVNQPQLSDLTRPEDDGSHPATPADGTTPGLDSPGRPRWHQGPAIGEEGL